MSVRAVLDPCQEHFIRLERAGDALKCKALFPDTHPLTDELITQVREHKPEILSWLDFEAEADALLIASTRRLAAAWPEGCELDVPTWGRYEERLRDAYHSGDIAAVEEVVHEREQFALGVFSAYTGREAA